MNVRKIRLDDSSVSPAGEERDEYEKDFARIIQSPAFRRLQGKSQVFGAGAGDYYRTRLTHSLEVAQIAREVARKLNRNEPLLRRKEHPGLIIQPEVVECAALAHDLGHPPFGHKGEEVLNRLLQQEHGLRFEGNAQNFRLLMFLEKRAGSDCGLDLTASVLLAVNKYPYCIDDPGRTKGVYRSEWHAIEYLRQIWGMPEGCATLEAQLMDLCDDIAYSTHDLDDGMRAGKIEMNRSFFEDERLIQSVAQEIRNDKTNEDMAWHTIDLHAKIRQVLMQYLEEWERIYFENGREPSRARREIIARWVGRYASKVGIIDAPSSGWKRVTFVQDGKEDLELMRTMEILKKLAWVTLLQDFRVQRLHKRSEVMIGRLWDSFKNYESGRYIIPPDWLENFERQKSRWSWERLVSDYLSGMTDAYAEKVYGEFFASRSGGSIYEID